MVVRTHNANGYRRGCRCHDCRTDEARRRREQRARKRRPCDICHRVHPGRCAPDADRSVRFTVMLPGHVDQRLRDHIDYGHRSKWVADVVELALDALAEAAA